MTAKSLELKHIDMFIYRFCFVADGPMIVEMSKFAGDRISSELLTAKDLRQHFFRLPDFQNKGMHFW